MKGYLLRLELAQYNVTTLAAQLKWHDKETKSSCRSQSTQFYHVDQVIDENKNFFPLL